VQSSDHSMNGSVELLTLPLFFCDARAASRFALIDTSCMFNDTSIKNQDKARAFLSLSMLKLRRYASSYYLLLC